MSTPATSTLSQGQKLLDLVKRATSEQMQNLLTNGDLTKIMLHADLSRVDRLAFKALLTSAPAPIAWQPVSEYADKIEEWNKLRGWGLTKTQITTFAAALVDHDHLDPLHPTGISLWLGHDLPYNWEEVMACLMYEVEALGEKFTPYVAAERVSFFPGSEQSGERKLTVALLDLATYWDLTNGVAPNEVRKKEAKLPGLEVAWLLALNAPVYLAIDRKTIPGLIAAGLVVDSDRVPCFERDPYEACVDGDWAGNHWRDSSVVRFREC